MHGHLNVKYVSIAYTTLYLSGINIVKSWQNFLYKMKQSVAFSAQAFTKIAHAQ